MSFQRLEIASLPASRTGPEVASRVAAPRVTSGVAIMLLLGCIAVSIAPRTAQAQDSFSNRESDLFYELLLSELALRRGELAVAAEGYASATAKTSDPRVAERATQLAVYYQNWDQAESIAQRWLALDPKAINAHESLVQIYLRQDDQAGAVEVLSHWVDAVDDKRDAFMAINATLQRNPSAELAYSVSSELSEKYPKQPEAYIGKAVLALAISDQDAALEAADKALELDASLVGASLIKAQAQISLGDSSDALETLQTAVTAQPDSLALHLGFAQLLVDSELYDQVEPVLARAGELSDGDPDTWLRLGLLSITANHYEQAQLFLMGVLEDDPLSESANFYLARILDRAQDNEAAIVYYDAVPEGEFYITARIRAAELTAESGNTADGIARLRKLSSLTTITAVKVQLLASESRILQEANRGDEAVEVLTAGLDIFPGNTDLLYSRALAGERNGNDQRLEDDLAAILELEPDNAQALNALGYHLAVRNTRLDIAETYLERASELEPNDAAIMDSLGWLRFRQNRLGDARRILSRAYELFPDPEIAAHLGEVLWVMGDEIAAQNVWDKALVDEPNHSALTEVIKRLVNK